MTVRVHTRNFPARLVSLLACLVVFSLVAGCRRPVVRPELVPLQILAINDFHGQISAGKKVGGRPVGSAPVLAAYLKKAQRQFGGFTFFVHAGDLVGASPPESSLLQGEPAIMFMNLLGNETCSVMDRLNPTCNLVTTVGNHEFDSGLKELLRLLQGGNHAKGPFLEAPWKGATFPCVAANVVSQHTKRPIFPPYVIKEVDGLPLAFIGAVLKETEYMVMPEHVVGLEFLDEAAAINYYVPELKDKQVRTIIVLLHQGGRQAAYEGPTRPGGEVAGAIRKIVWHLDDEVDVVISGHTHAFSNALIPNQHGKEILVTQAWYAGRGFADIKLELSRTTRDVVSKAATIVTAWADAGPGLTPTPEATNLMLAAEQKVAPRTRRKIAVAARDIIRDQNRAGESALGNLIADAQRKATGADFAFLNPGGIRTNISAGEVTWGELYAVQPFNNSLVKMELTGQQIYDLLNQQFPPGQTYHRMLQVSGLTYTWDDRAAPPGRITEVRRDGKLIDRAANYSVTVNSFLAAGGDKFSVFKQGRNKKEGPGDLEALITYIQGLPQPFRAGINGRIQRLP